MVGLASTVVLAAPVAATPPAPGAHNATCRVADAPLSRAERRAIVRACLRDPSDHAALRLGFHTAMAGDIDLVSISDYGGHRSIKRFARAALAEPQAARLVRDARQGAADYARVIHRGGMWTTPERMVSYQAGRTLQLLGRGPSPGPDPVIVLALLMAGLWLWRQSRHA